MKNEEAKGNKGDLRYNIVNHYYFHLEDRESIDRAGSPCITGRVWHESQLERVAIESIIGKRAVVTDNHSRVYIGLD